MPGPDEIRPAPFEFSTAQRVIFGVGVRRKLPELLQELACTRPLIVAGSSEARWRGVVPVDCLKRGRVVIIRGEPTTQLISQTRADLWAEQEADGPFDGVVALGGGSVMDAGKALAALLPNRGPLLDYLEVVGKGKPLDQSALPLIAMPTTSGTGSEATRNAVLKDEHHQAKISLRHASMLPRIALVDPELCLTLPFEVTASTGLDALTQLIEAWVCLKSQPMTDALCVAGIPRAARALATLHSQPESLAARSDLSLASLWSGMALANAGLGAVHGFAAALGGMIEAPHGVICAALLPHAVGKNIKVLQVTGANPEALSKYRELGKLLNLDDVPDDWADRLVQHLRALTQQWRIPSLRSLGVREDQHECVVSKALAASSMKGNPVALSKEDLKEILSHAEGEGRLS